MEQTVKDRTIAFVKHKGITMKTFEKKCGLSSGYVTSMRKGFGSEKLNNVLSAFPELNRDWLIFGEGEMLLSHIGHTQTGSANKIEHSPINIGSGTELEQLKKENELLKERLKDKEEIIKLLKSKK